MEMPEKSRAFTGPLQVPERKALQSSGRFQGLLLCRGSRGFQNFALRAKIYLCPLPKISKYVHAMLKKIHEATPTSPCPGVFAKKCIRLRVADVRAKDAEYLATGHIGRNAVYRRLAMAYVGLWTAKIIVPHVEVVGQLALQGDSMLLAGKKLLNLRSSWRVSGT